MVGRLLRIRTSRHPHEILVTVVAVLVGILGAFIPDRISPAVNATFGQPEARFFYAFMAAFGVMVLWSMRHRRVDSMLLERAGLIGLGFFFAGYGVAVLAERGLGSGLISTIIPFSFAVANVARIVQIKVDLALLRDYLKDHPDEVEVSHGEHW